MSTGRLTEQELYEQGEADGWASVVDPDLATSPHYLAGAENGKRRRVEAWQAEHPDRPWPGATKDGKSKR